MTAQGLVDGVTGLVRSLLELLGRFVLLAALLLRGAVRRRWAAGELWRQMYHVGNRSALFVMVTLGFIGMVLVFQTCLQINRVTGDLSQVGAEFAKILVHEFGPSLTAMMLATRVGAGEQPVRALRRNRSDAVLEVVVVDGQVAVVDEAHERRPAFQAVIEGAGKRRPVSGLLSVEQQPAMEGVQDG